MPKRATLREVLRNIEEVLNTQGGEVILDSPLSPVDAKERYSMKITLVYKPPLVDGETAIDSRQFTAWNLSYFKEDTT